MNGDPLDELEEAWAEVKRLESEVACARACADIMLQGTGQKIGEELARRVMDQHSPPQWIPVSERLPEGDELTAVLGWNGVSVREVVFAPRARHDDHWSSAGGHEFITHWMPLPEPPEVK